MFSIKSKQDVKSKIPCPNRISGDNRFSCLVRDYDIAQETILVTVYKNMVFNFSLVPLNENVQINLKVNGRKPKKKKKLLIY